MATPGCHLSWPKLYILAAGNDITSRSLAGILLTPGDSSRAVKRDKSRARRVDNATREMEVTGNGIL
jgi:hypothetical protein